MPTDDNARRGLLNLLVTSQSTPASPDDETKDAPPPSLHTIRPPATVVPAGLDSAHRFVDHGEIARGGMGVVHRVLERSLNRVVALKVLKPEKNKDDNARKRFIAEAQITGQLEHPYIVPVYELGVDDSDQLFFTMKLIEGRTLQDVVESDHPERNDDALTLAIDAVGKVADALSFAHSRGVIHRDLKPGNIMLGEHGQVVLMDWGIARVPDPAPPPTAFNSRERRTTSITMFAVEPVGQVLGTFGFMSPEQARGDIPSMDARTDVFGLGAVLFRIVSGEPPIQGKDRLEALARAGSGQVADVRSRVRGRLRRGLLDVALQAMQREPDQRFSNVGAFKRAIDGVMHGGLRFAVQRFVAGRTIVQEGSHGTDAFIVKSGTCEVLRGTDGAATVLGTFETGDVFGETAIVTRQPRNASVRALTDVELWVVPGAVLEDELGLDGWLGGFVRSLGKRLTETNLRVTHLDGELQRERVLAHTWRLLAQGPSVTLDGVAAASGMERERVHALLSAVPHLIVAGDGAVRLAPGSGSA